jgi:hypothetical protein
MQLIMHFWPEMGKFAKTHTGVILG